MIRWFLIGCAIVGGFTGGVTLWEALPDRAQNAVKLALLFAVVSALVGGAAWFYFGGGWAA